MAFTHTATVVLSSGTEVDVFDRYTVSLDMMKAGSPWTVSMWRSEARASSWDVLRREVKAGENLTVAIDGAAQITGRIEALDTRTTREGAMIIASGRDLGGVAATWDADPTVRLRGLALSDALTALFAPMGIPVLITDAAAARIVQDGTNRASLGSRHVARRNTSAGTHATTRGVSAAHARRRAQPIDRSHPRAGEQVWALATEMCRRVGFLLWVAPSAEGGIACVVDVPAFTGADVYLFTLSADPTSRATNILKGAEKLSVAAVPTEVNVYTGTTRGDLISNRSRSQTFNVGLGRSDVSRGLIADPMPAQVRHIKSARARTIAAAAQEGERTIAEAMAGFRRYECTVQGHGQIVDGAMRLYALNTMSHVRDELCTSATGEPLDESMLITSLRFDGGRGSGSTTDLTLVPKDSIQVIPQEAS